MRIRLKARDLKYVITSDFELYHYGHIPPDYYKLAEWNNGQLKNLQRAHLEIQDMIEKAVKKASSAGVPLEDIAIVCPQLMDISCWGGYFGTPWDENCNAQQLRAWFAEKFG